MQRSIANFLFLLYIHIMEQLQSQPQKPEFKIKTVIIFYPDGQEEKFTKGEQKVKELVLKHQPAFKVIEVHFEDNTLRVFADFPFEVQGELKQPSPIVLPQEGLIVPKK